MIDRIKTKNIKEEIFDCINSFIEKLSQRDEVLCIILLGGLGKRDFMDEFSDADISVVINKKNIKKFPLPFEFHYKFNDRLIEFNIHQLVLEDEINTSLAWNDSKIEAYSNAIIVYDPNDFGKKILESKVCFNEQNAYNRLIWIIQQYRWRGQIHSIRAFKRGYPAASHDLLNNCVELFLEAIFLINDRYLPHRKWIFPFLDELKIDAEIQELFKDAMIIKDFSYKSIIFRIEKLNRIFDYILKLIKEKYPNFPLNTYEYYYRNFVQLNNITIVDKKFYELTGKHDILNEVDEELFGKICFHVDKL